jgi:hypothetical protein
MPSIISTSPDIYGVSQVRQVAANATIAVVPGVVVLTAPSPVTCTLPLPRPGADDGKTLTFVSQSAAQHVITTAPGGFNGGYSNFTMNGFIGNSTILTAVRGAWSVATITKTQARSGVLS